jgi:uncharacterized protein (DUF983 family)
MSYPYDPLHPAHPYAYRWFRREREERCPKCGARVSKTDNYCPRCGEKLKHEDIPKASDKDMALLGLFSFLIGFPVCLIFFASFIGIHEAIVFSLFLSFPTGFILLIILSIIIGILKR